MITSERNILSEVKLDKIKSLISPQINFYRENGFVRIPKLITKEEATHYKKVALDYCKEKEQQSLAHGEKYQAVFTQLVNAWQNCEELKKLTLHPTILEIAKSLAGVPLRLWHDQLLIKKPHNKTRTEFHQDQPYWPHQNSKNPISVWIALCDVPVERGCMTFIPKAQSRTNLIEQNLHDSNSLFDICPDLQWEERLTVPLQAGDATFHHGRSPHMANANDTDEPRVAHVAIYIDRDTIYTGEKHVVTDPLNLKEGRPFPENDFPII